MPKTTITEALSEINLIKKKIEKKREFLRGNTVRMEHQRDPYENEGGAKKLNDRELQSLDDLYTRLVQIRSAISQANLEHSITLGEKTMKIQDWLTWKREVANQYTNDIASLHKSTRTQLDQAQKNPQAYRDEKNEPGIVKLLPNFEITALMKKEEQLTTMFEELDGKLSLKNATILIDV